MTYHCSVCEDFDLCEPCHEKESHPHKMEKLDLDVDMGSSLGNLNEYNAEETRELSTNRCTRCIQSLDHASRCRGPNCRLPSCQKMKRVVTHSKICKRKKKECNICEQMVTMYYYHAKHCQEVDCSMPLCSNLKQKMKQQQNKIQ